MKKGVFGMLLIASLLGGDEIERINNLAKEVEALRIHYDACMQKLQLCSQNGSSKSDSLLQKCKHDRTVRIGEKRSKNEKERKKIRYLESRIKEYEKTLKAKEEKIAILEKELLRLQKERSKKKESSKKREKKRSCVKTLKTKNCPTSVVVVQKSKERTHLILKKDGNVAVKKSSKITITQPRTFRTRSEAPIYDAKDGKIVNRWEKGRSFTSYIESGDWIKITGYFINRKWTKAKEELWIKKCDTMKH